MNLFSKSQNKHKKPVALTYDLPSGLRTQIIHLWRKGFGKEDRYSPGPQMAYERIHHILCEEHQEPQLPQVSRHSLTYGDIIAEYFYHQDDTNKALDVIQVVFSVMEAMIHRTRNAWGHDMFSSEYIVSDIIDELNHRFKENNVGYHYIQGRVEKIPQGPEPIPLKERLIAGEPATNLRKINDQIGRCIVTAIHDPYTTTGSLDTILKLAGMGANFSPCLRILGTAKPLANSTEKKSLLGLLKDINTERKASWQIRVYSATTKPHRRFLILDDGSIVTCGMSLNHIDKDEVLDHEPSGSENAKHDIQLFEDEWKTATSI